MYHVSAQGVDERMINVHYYKLSSTPLGGLDLVSVSAPRVTHIHTHTRTHARTQTRTHARTHTNTHARTHARTHTQTQNLAHAH